MTTTTTMTAQDLIAALSVLKPDTPVIMVITDTDRACNVTGFQIESSGDDAPVVGIIECADNYDPRQW